MALHPMSLTLVILASRWDKTGRGRERGCCDDASDEGKWRGIGRERGEG